MIRMADIREWRTHVVVDPRGHRIGELFKRGRREPVSKQGSAVSTGSLDSFRGRRGG
ncbi:hypothetical protein BN2537_9181 [Streptomyces venezuelae]|nr:hypothetical protein BN2537_9181 [Streptomyces venezuelae]